LRVSGITNTPFPAGRSVHRRVNIDCSIEKSVVASNAPAKPLTSAPTQAVRETVAKMNNAPLCFVDYSAAFLGRPRLLP
jgi:hypothetical protein